MDGKVGAGVFANHGSSAAAVYGMPVAMAASTTALGMSPLIRRCILRLDGGGHHFRLMCATVLTMVVLPVFYAILFHLPSK